MKIALISANLGGIDGSTKPNYIPQQLPKDWEVKVFYHDSTNTVVRTGSLHPRIQAKMYRMLGWEMYPGFDYYIWLDAGFDLVSDKAIYAFVKHCEEHDIAMFKHSMRQSIQSEALAVINLLKAKDQYIIERYTNEPMIEQVHHYLEIEKYKDTFLVETGAFCYRPTEKIKAMLKDWYYECCRWTCQDQLSLPVVVIRHNVDITFFPTSIHKTGLIQHTWHQRR